MAEIDKEPLYKPNYAGPIKGAEPLCACGQVLLGDQIKRGCCEQCVNLEERCMHGNKKPCRLCEADT